MSRVLKATTIIPDALYVPRAADRQLAQIVEDMGRPGYVLVARQMGKTNLLLHMKRRQEEAGDVVIYVDLSERFESAHACLRHIIDIAIETHPALFCERAADIRAARAGRESEAALEFGQHVRLLISAIPGRKLIIVLDEVDSLINCGYGDTILSQVRSTYFQRTNFSEYNQITYVLSGVAEPTDLIQDKNISPFNIGEKIYLADFSRTEFDEFIVRANLDVSSAVTDAIYHWAAGNPRMTWDICAAIEQELEEGKKATPGLVEEVIQHLYLTEFDLPPIDHIRTLVSGEKALRDALVSVRYNKAATINSRIKSRLYLAGITSTPAADIQIKNRIIDHALSDSWLAQVNESNLLSVAAEHLAGGRHGAVVDTLTSFREAAGEALPPLSQLQLGIALCNLGRFEEAAKELRSAAAGFSGGDHWTTSLYYHGAALYLSEQIEEGILALEEAAEKGSGPNRAAARILLAAAYYHTAVPGGDVRGATIREGLVDDIERAVADGLLSRETLTGAIYNLAISVGAYGDAVTADRYFATALDLAPVEQRPVIAISAASFEIDPNAKARSLKAAANAVVAHSLRFSVNGEATMAFREKTMAGLVLSLLDADLIEAANDILAYATSLYLDGRSETDILIAFGKMLNENSTGSTLPLLHFIDSQKSRFELDKPQQLALLRMFGSHVPERDRHRFHQRYFTLLSQIENLDEISDDDALFIVLTIQNLSAAGRGREAIAFIDLAAPQLARSGRHLWTAILLYFKMNTSRVAEDFNVTKEAAQEILDLKIDYADEQLEDKELGTFIDNILIQARSTLRGHDPAAIDIFRGIGRNQKVVVTEPDGGNERTVKFKTVELKLRTGRLVMVRAHPR